MPGFTDRGMSMMFDFFFRGAAAPTNFYVALCTSAQTPSATTNVLGTAGSDLTQITTGNGYSTGGFILNRDTTDFPTPVKDLAADQVQFRIKDVTWTAGVSGNLPLSGNGARWAVLTDDNPTVGSRQVIFWWDLIADRTVSTGQPLSLQNLKIYGQTPAGITNQGMFRIYDAYFRNQNVPTSFFTALITNGIPPTPDTQAFSSVTEIAIGNGYNTAGGSSLSRNSTDFDDLQDNDPNTRGEVRLKNIVFTASGGTLPVSGAGARWMTLLDNNATFSSRDVLVYWDLGADRSVTTGNPITVSLAKLYGTN